MEKSDDARYRFTYAHDYIEDPSTLPISLTLSKRSETLFPFFFGLLSEGSTKAIQCRTLKIDEQDHFELLLSTGEDCIGSVSVVRIQDQEESYER